MSRELHRKSITVYVSHPHTVAMPVPQTNMAHISIWLLEVKLHPQNYILPLPLQIGGTIIVLLIKIEVLYNHLNSCLFFIAIILMGICCASN